MKPKPLERKWSQIFNLSRAPTSACSVNAVAWLKVTKLPHLVVGDVWQRLLNRPRFCGEPIWILILVISSTQVGLSSTQSQLKTEAMYCLSGKLCGYLSPLSIRYRSAVEHSRPEWNQMEPSGTVCESAEKCERVNTCGWTSNDYEAPWAAVSIWTSIFSTPRVLQRNCFASPFVCTSFLEQRCFPAKHHWGENGYHLQRPSLQSLQ